MNRECEYVGMLIVSRTELMTHDFSMDWQELWLAVIYLVLEANMEVYDLLIIEHINIFIHISIHISQ